MLRGTTVFSWPARAILQSRLDSQQQRCGGGRGGHACPVGPAVQ
jgi:hypothetical protein